jgi:hypothetical protein
MKTTTILSKLAIPVIISAIVIYLALSAWLGIRDPYTFVTAYDDVMETSAVASGWVVRHELPITGGNGLVRLLREQDEKVGKGQVIAEVYQDENYEEHQEELRETQAELSALQYATWSGSPTGAVLEAQMLSSMADLQTAAAAGNFAGMGEATELYRKTVLRREYLVSEEAANAMDAAGWVLNQKYNELQAVQTGASTIWADAAGVFSTHMDGYETVLDTSMLEAQSPEGLERLARIEPQADSGYLGKLITSPEWFYCAVMDGEYADRFNVGGKVNIHFNALSTTLKMKVQSVSEVQDGQVVVLFRSNQDVEQADQLRREASRVVFTSAEGIRVPKEALRVDEDGQPGVYVASGHNARFRPVKILAEDDVGYLVKAAPADGLDTRILRAGDEVVLASDTLYDGKVVR